MKKIEINEEYENYEIKSSHVTSLELFRKFIQKGLDDIEKQLSFVLKEINFNDRNKRIAKIKNFFLRNYFYDLSIYDDDNNVLNELFCFLLGYKIYFYGVLEIGDLENFRELTRLIDFSCEYFLRHLDYFEAQRDMVEYQAKGIQYSSIHENRIKEFDEFFFEKMDEISSAKNIEKIKKI